MTEQPAAAVLALLRQRSATLATAESLTGGLLGELLTDIAGASACYVGGVITYATRLKGTLGGVSVETLARHGPVAAQTAAEMAVGVARSCSADWGVAVTGVAGPDPQDHHPVGQVFVAVARPVAAEIHVRELRLSGDRAAVRTQTAVAALALLGEVLGMPDHGSGVVPG